MRWGYSPVVFILRAHMLRTERYWIHTCNMSSPAGGTNTGNGEEIRIADPPGS